MLTTSSRSATLGLAVGSLAVLAGCQAGDAPTSVNNDAVDDTATTDSADVTEAPEPQDDGVTSTPGPIADGTYTATGGYQSPNGPETVVVTLTVADGVVSEAVVEPQATNATSSRYQGQFAGGIAGEIVGKPLSEVSVTRVAGSSLTGGGFKEALDQIRAEAQAADTSSSSSAN